MDDEFTQSSSRLMKFFLELSPQFRILRHSKVARQLAFHGEFFVSQRYHEQLLPAHSMREPQECVKAASNGAIVW